MRRDQDTVRDGLAKDRAARDERRCMLIVTEEGAENSIQLPFDPERNVAGA